MQSCTLAIHSNNIRTPGLRGQNQYYLHYLFHISWLLCKLFNSVTCSYYVLDFQFLAISANGFIGNL